MGENLRDINGIRFYTMPNRAMRQFCLYLYVLAGSMYEDAKVNGITHMFEHAVFRNIKQKYDGHLYELLAANGLYFNAATYSEFLVFKVEGLPIGIELAADIIASVFDDLSIEKVAFQTEKERIISEIIEEDAKNTLTHFGNCRIWKGTSLTKPITGTCSTVEKITQKRLNEYKKSILTKENIFLYATGNVSEQDMELIEKRIGDIPISRGKANGNMAPIPLGFGNREPHISVMDCDYYRVQLSFDVDNSICDVAVRDILYDILFACDDAELNMALSENTGIIYSYDSNLEQYNNISELKLEYYVERVDLRRSICEIVSVLQKIKKGDFCFENNIQKQITAFESEWDSPQDLNWSMAYNNHILSGVPIDYDKPLLGRYADLTKERVMEAAREIFRTRNLTLSVKGNRYYVNKMNLWDVVQGIDE